MPLEQVEAAVAWQWQQETFLAALTAELRAHLTEELRTANTAAAHEQRSRSSRRSVISCSTRSTTSVQDAGRPEVAAASRRAHLFTLAHTVDADLGRRGTGLWHVPSRAAHHHVYELAPVHGVVGRLAAFDIPETPPRGISIR